MIRKSFLNSTNHVPTAIFLVLVASFFSALMALFVKLSSTSMPISYVLLSRFVISWVICVSSTLVKRKKFRMIFSTFHPKLQILRAVTGSVSLLCFFYAVKYLSLGTATVLFSVSPFFVPIIARVWKKVSFYKPLWWVMALGFVGILIVIHPHRYAFGFGAILGLVSGIGTAFVVFFNRVLAYDESTITTLFYDFTIGILFSIAWIIFRGVHYPTIDGNIVYLLGVGLAGYAYLYFSVASTRYAPVRLSAPFMYATTIFSVLFDWIIWGIVPTVLALSGIMLIVISGILMLYLYPYQK